MSNIFSNSKAVKSDSVETDYLGGGGLFDTDIYGGTIKYAYIGKAANSDARNATVCVKFDNGKELTKSIWMTSRSGDVTYKEKRTGELRNLPGYTQVNALAMLLTSKEVGDLDVEEKKLSLYDYDAKAEVLQDVMCFVELHGERVNVAVERQTVDKTEKDKDTGEYVPTGETKDVNEFIKFFAGDKQVTISEVQQFVKSLGGDFNEVLADGDLDKAISKMEDKGAYATKWLEDNQGEIRDRSTKKKEGKEFKGGSSGSSSGGEEKKSSSLFDD